MDVTSLLSKKLLFALGLVAAATVALVSGVCTWDQWTEFSKWIFGLFVGGNAIEKIAGAVVKKNGSGK